MNASFRSYLCAIALLSLASGCALRVNETGSTEDGADTVSTISEATSIGTDGIGTDTDPDTVGTDTVDDGFDGSEESPDMAVLDEGQPFLPILDMGEDCFDVMGTVEAFDNSDLNGLQNTAVIEGDLFIADSVSSLAALSCLQEVVGVIFIADTFALESLEGLHNLKSAGGLVLISNQGLVSIQSLEPEGMTIEGELSIVDNPELRTCDARQFQIPLNPQPEFVCIDENKLDGCLDVC